MSCCEQRRVEIRRWLAAAADDPWFLRHVDALPSGYIIATPPQQVAADLRIAARHGARRGDRHGPIPRRDGHGAVHHRRLASRSPPAFSTS